MTFVVVSLFVTLILFFSWGITKNRSLFLWTLAVANGTLILMFLSFIWHAFPYVRDVNDKLLTIGKLEVAPMLNTISLGTALEFALMCVAGLFFMAKRTKPVIVLLWSVIGVGLFAIVGHAANVPWMAFSFGRLSGAMPLITAISFVVLAGIGLIAHEHISALAAKDRMVAKAAQFRSSS